MFRINEPSIAWEDVGGTILLVRIETGSYFSVSGTGADALRRLTGGHSLFATTAAIADHYHLALSDVADSLAEFLSQLIGEGLVAPLTARAFGTRLSSRALTVPPLSEHFSTPELFRIDQQGNRLSPNFGEESHRPFRQHAA